MIFSALNKFCFAAAVSYVFIGVEAQSGLFETRRKHMEQVKQVHWLDRRQALRQRYPIPLTLRHPVSR